MLRVGNNQIQTGSQSTNTTNNSMLSSKKIYNRRKFVNSGSESTSSEDAEEIYKYRKKTLRALSDYESDKNDIEIASSSLASSSTENTKKSKLTKKPTFNAEIYSSSNSDSEDSMIFQNRRRPKVLRQLSDYETGDSIENAEESLNMASVNHSLVNSTNLSHQSNNFYESSDDSFYNIRRIKCKRPRFLSTSDSSDSDTPVRFQSSRKRTRMIASSDESDGESMHLAQSSRRRQTRPVTRTTTSRTSSVHARPQVRRQLRPRNQDHRRYVESEIEDDSSSIEVRRPSRRVARISNNSSNSMVGNVVAGTRNLRQLNRRGIATRNRRNAGSEQANNRSSAVGPVSDAFTEYRGQVQRHRIITFVFPQRDDNYFTVSGRSSTLLPAQRYVDSSDSDSSLPLRPRVRGSAVPILDSDSDSNSGQDLPNVSSNPGTSYTNFTPTKTEKMNEKSTDSEAESEKCPICFSCFGSKEVASPVSCGHLFCTFCIQEWAKNNNTCPIDRKLFNKIIVRSSFNSGIVREIPIEDPSAETRSWQINTFFMNDEVRIELPVSYVSSSDEDDEICCICLTSSSFGDLILCDFCNNVYHMSCLNPPLRSLPVRDWFCPSCVEHELDSD